jgi:hypothetical protein
MNLRNLQFLFKPSYWHMNYRYNEDVDKIVNELLYRYELTDLCNMGCTCKLGKATIWVANEPYASGTLHGTELENFRPSRLTIQRISKRLHKLKYTVSQRKVNRVRKEFL